MVKIIIGIVIFVVIALVVGFVPIMEVPYTETVQYQDTETYYVDEPYEVVETYTENIPLSFKATSYVKDDVVKEISTLNIGGWITETVKETPVKVACVDVMNTDNEAGSFTVDFSGISPMFGSPSLTIILDLSPGEEKTAVCLAEYIDDWSYDVTPGTKEVEMEGTVTKYRQVEKERTVTKERTETRYKRVSIFEYLISKF